MIQKTNKLEISAIRSRGFAMAQAIITELGRLDDAIRMATEGNVDDRNARDEVARRLARLLDGGPSQ